MVKKGNKAELTRHRIFVQGDRGHVKYFLHPSPINTLLQEKLIDIKKAKGA